MNDELTDEPLNNMAIKKAINQGYVKLSEIEENTRKIKNYLAFFLLMAILGLILGFCSALGL